MLAAALLTIASGCAGGRAVDSWCLIEKPVRPTAVEIAAMSDAQVEKTLAHNEYGAKECGWRAK